MTQGHLTRPGIGRVVLVWIFMAALTELPYLRATMNPPSGTSFLGFFYFVDDSYHYLSFVQQAEDGAFLFRNKLVLEDHAAVLVNLEWWLVGRLSAALGRRPLLAYRLFGAGGALALLLAADLWLRRAGLAETHRLSALVLVATGGGLGGLLFQTGARPLSRCTDLTTGLFPFVEMLTNPHFVAGTALLLWSLWAFLEAASFRGLLRAILLGSALGLMRPYDFVLLVAVRSVGILLVETPAAWPRRFLPLLGLLPVVAYDGYVFYWSRAFSFFPGAPYPSPGLVDVLLAVGPPALLAMGVAACRGVTPEAVVYRRHLVAWVFLAGMVAVIQPVHFSLQFLVGLGLPLLALGALALARFRPVATWIAAVVLSGTAVAAVRIVLGPNPRWYPPAERLAAALALRGACHPGDMALAPPDIGLYIAGLTACKAYVSHPIAPDYEERETTARDFFASWDAESRSAFLDQHRIDHLVLPAAAGTVPRTWLGEATPFRLSGRANGISLYSRQGRHGG